MATLARAADLVGREQAGLLCMLGAAALSAATALCVKLAAGGLPFYEIGFYRQLGAGLPALLALAWLGRPLMPREPGVLAWRGALGCASMLTYYLGIAWLPLSTASLLGYTSPFFTALFAAVALQEHVPARTWWCMVVGMAGVALVLDPHGGLAIPGVAAALASACCQAAATIALKRATAVADALTIVAFTSLVSAALCLPGLAYHYVPPDANAWLALAGAAACGMTSSWCFTQGVRLAPTASAAAVSLASPFFAAMFGATLLAETPSAGFWPGALLVLGAGAALYRR